MPTLSTLDGCSAEELLDTFNGAFADYLVPLQLTSDQLQSKMLTENTYLQYSIGAFDQGKLVGFILHGGKLLDGTYRFYNGGTGVLPAYRGHGLTQKMYHHFFEITRSLNVASTQLEVLEGNLPAIKSYLHAGFKIARKVACFKCTSVHTSQKLELTIGRSAAIDWNQYLSWCSITPTWQNDRSAIERTPSKIILQASNSFELIGAIMADAQSGKIFQLAVHPAYRQKGVATQLLLQLHNELNRPLSITNVDTQAEAAIIFLTKRGFSLSVNQYELICKSFG